MDKERKEILDMYHEYFKEDLDAINEELETSKKYSAIIDKEINLLSGPGLQSKGSQHYLIEHITNAVQLQTQREGLRKDKVAIKKAIMDYTNRQIDKTSNATNEESILDAISNLLSQDKAQQGMEKKPSEASNEESDAEIDKILNETEEGN